MTVHSTGRAAFNLLKLALVLACMLRVTSSQGLQVSITTSPQAPPFPAATWILLSCDINTTMPVTYDWIAYRCDNTILVTFEDFNNPGVFTIRVRSTPSICLGDINCTAMDMLGRTGQASWRVGQATGAGLWGTTQPLSNNSAMVADAQGGIASIDCHSASTQTDIGRWFSPNGNDITFNTNDNFDVMLINGDFLSFSRLQLVSGVAFSSANQGVFTCLIPDENGIEQNVHVGIYANGYSEILLIPTVQRISQSPLVVECITTGLPPTTAIWAKSPNVISTNTTYQIVRVLTNALTTSYSHRLTVAQTIEQARGLYYCLFQNELTGPVQDSAGPSVSGVIHFFSMYLPGDVEALICTISGADVMEWRNGNTDELVSPSNAIEIRVNDSIHHTPYICYGYSGSTLVGLVQFTVIVNVPNTALQVSAAETSTPIVGSSYSVVCLGAKTVAGVINDPVSVWLDSNGNQLIDGGGISLLTTSPGELTLSFSPLQTSHAGLYTCQASLSSPALSSPLVGTAPFTATLQIPLPLVVVQPTEPGPYFSGGSFTLNCTVFISSHVDTPVAVSIAWRSTRMQQGPLSSGGRVAISEVVAIGSLQYQSSFTLSDLSVSTDAGAVYSCTAGVSSAPPSPLVTTSPAAASSIAIDVLAPVLTVSLDPSSVTALDVSPFNSFFLSCNGSTTVDNAAAAITVEWSKQISGSSTSTVVSHNGATVNITTTVSDNSQNGISQLSAIETIAGTYTYTCTFTVQEPGDDPVLQDANATVNIQGPAVPLLPTNVQATVMTFTSAAIEWDVPSIAYAPESYLLEYGTTPQALDQSMQVAGSAAFSTLDQHFIIELVGLQINTMYYYQLTATNLVGSTSTTVLSFMIEDIPLITFITASGPPTAGETLILTCTVTEEEDIPGIPTVTWLGPAGQTISTGGDFTVVHQLTGLTTTLTLQFFPLRSSHNGLYTCRADLANIPHVETANFTLSVNVATLPARIEGSSSTFVAATPLTLTCLPGAGAVGAVMYQWSSTCTGECFVATQTTFQLSRSALRSADSGQHTCSVTDEVGNVGSATLDIIVEGVGVYLSGIGVLSNNTVLLAGPGGNIERLQCISGSTTPNVGLWISPSGQDITNFQTDPFDTTVGGSTNPGHLDISPAPGETITSFWEGVYTCSIPDETGDQQVFYIGIYTTAIPPSAVSVASLSNPPSFTLVCTSTGSAASSVVWRKEGVLLAEGNTYMMSQALSSGATSTYDNFLRVVNTLDTSFLPGDYSCEINNTFGSSEISKTFSGIQIMKDPQDVFIAGQLATMTCTSDLGVSSVEWLGSTGVVLVSSFGSSAVFRFDPVTDFIHNTRYVCRTVADFGTQERDVDVLVEVNVDDIVVNISASPLPSFIGQNLTVVCTVQTPPNLVHIPTIRWQYSTGSPIVNAADVTVRTEILLTNGGSRSTVFFHPLSLMHGMDVVCLVDMNFNAPPYNFSEAAEFDLVVSSPSFPASPANISATMVGPISAVVQWKVPVVLFTPEDYVVDYGTTTDVFPFQTLTIQGNQNVALTNQVYSVSLTELFPSNEYFFRVVARNIIGTTNSDIASFTTLSPETVIPHAPVNVNILEVMSTTVFVGWTVPTVASLREQYVATYGTDQNSLTQISNVVQGLLDTSIDNQVYNVMLTSLTPRTTYFVRVLAINSIDSSSSEVVSFTTTEGDYQCTIHFQVLLGEVSECSQWRSIDTRQKLSDIRSSLFQTFQEKCRCAITEDDILNAQFLCFENPKYVVFRATLSANSTTSAHCDEIVTTLLEDRKDSIMLQDENLLVDPYCRALIDTLEENFDCDPVAVTSSPGRLTSVTSGTIVGVVFGVIAIVIILAIISVCALIVAFRYRKRNFGGVPITLGQSDDLAFENPCYLENTNPSIPSSDIVKHDLGQKLTSEEDDSFVKENPLASDFEDPPTYSSINVLDGENAEISVGDFDHNEKQPLEKALDGYPQ